MKGIHELFDIHHKLIGVFVEPEVWALIKKRCGNGFKKTWVNGNK